MRPIDLETHTPALAGVLLSPYTRLLVAASTCLILGCDSAAPAAVEPPKCAVPSPAISAFTATPSSVVAGQSATLSWTVTGATQIALTPSPGALGSSTVVVTPAATTTYQLSATNCAGTTTAQTLVTIAPPAPAPTLYVSPDQFTPATPIDGFNVQARYGVGSNAYTRTTPILIRYPQGATGRRPLVLWSHGGGMLEGGKYNNEDWGNLFVRAGYIVVHMSHMPKTATEFRALYTEFGITVPDSVTSAVAEFAASIDRPRDAISVLNALATLETTYPQLAGRIDYDRIGLAGWSRGSYTARTVACARINVAPNILRYSFRDTTKATNTPLRVQPKTVLAMSPQGPGSLGFYDNGAGDHSWSTCTLPDLTQTASGDNSDTPFTNRIAPFPLLPAGNKYLMFISDVLATHESFGLNNPSAPQFDPWITSTALAFLDGHLKGLAVGRAYLASSTLQTISNGKATVTTR